MLTVGVDCVVVATVNVVGLVKIAPGDVVELALRDDFGDIGEDGCIIVDVVVDVVVVVVVVVVVLDTGRV